MAFGNEKKITEDGGEGGEYLDNPVTTSDAVFGELTEEGPNYRAVSWTQCSIPRTSLTLPRSAGKAPSC